MFAQDTFPFFNWSGEQRGEVEIVLQSCQSGEKDRRFRIRIAFRQREKRPARMAVTTGLPAKPFTVSRIPP